MKAINPLYLGRQWLGQDVHFQPLKAMVIAITPNTNKSAFIWHKKGSSGKLEKDNCAIKQPDHPCSFLWAENHYCWNETMTMRCIGVLLMILFVTTRCNGDAPASRTQDEMPEMAMVRFCYASLFNISKKIKGSPIQSWGWDLVAKFATRISFSHKTPYFPKIRSDDNILNIEDNLRRSQQSLVP